MERALALAARGRGATSPNPMVGAVVVRQGQVIGEGFHARAGARHAEVAALDAAGDASRGATLYCTLEPCAHTGRTGPCVERIVRDGLTRVVLAVEDPDRRVNGAGVRFLRKHGIEVVVGVGRRAATRLNEAFFTVKRLGRPFVTLKAAVSQDGGIAAAPGCRTALTGVAAQLHAHRVRAEVDALAVGSGTILVDDPLLTARGDHARRRPLVRVLFDTRLRTPPTARILGTLEHGPVVVMTTTAARAAVPERAAALERAGARIEALEGRSVRAAVERLLAYDVSSLLVEGGAALYGAVWGAGLVDRVRLYVAPVSLGPTGVAWLPAGWRDFAALPGCRTWCLGEDVVMETDVQRID